MPQYWTRLESSDPEDRLTHVQNACSKHHATLVGNQIYYDDDGNAWALLATDNDQYNWGPLLNDRDLKAIDWSGRVNAHEKKAGKRPPPNGRRGQAAS